MHESGGIYSRKASLLDIQSNRAHKLQSIAGLNDSRAQPVVEAQFAVFEVIFKMEVCGSGSQRSSNFSQSQIVSRKQSNGASLQQVPDNSLRADAAVVRIRSL